MSEIKMKLAIGISTMDEGLYTLFEKIRDIPAHIQIIISCQYSKQEPVDEKLDELPNVLIVKKREHGLSKSRNVLLATAVSEKIDNLIISDDDVYYNNDGLKKLELYLNEQVLNPRHYQCQSCDERKVLRKRYRENSFDIQFKDIFRISSIEMCLNIHLIARDELKFDEEFGLGSRYPAGEEPVFIADAIKKRHKIKFIPITITIHPLESSGARVYTDELALRARGAIFRRVTNPLISPILIFLFWLKKFCIEKHYVHNKISKTRALGILTKGYFYK